MFGTPIEISPANGGRVYADSSGTRRASGNGLEYETGLRNVHYAPGIHTRLMSRTKPHRQGCVCGIEPRDWNRDLFTNIAMVNNVYLTRLSSSIPRLAAWTMGGSDAVMTDAR